MNRVNSRNDFGRDDSTINIVMAIIIIIIIIIRVANEGGWWRRRDNVDAGWNAIVIVSSCWGTDVSTNVGPTWNTTP